MNIYKKFEEEIKTILKSMIVSENQINLDSISVIPTKNYKFGDLSTNAAIIAGNIFKKSPKNIAEKISTFLQKNPDVLEVEISEIGFINWKLKNTFWQKFLKKILQMDANYGKSNLGKNKKVNIEYVSANPTGFLHIGHCRGAVLGDVISNLLIFSGYNVTKEYYVNDTGGQIDIFIKSIFFYYCHALGKNINKSPDNLYPKEFLNSIVRLLINEFGDDLVYMNNEKSLLIIKKKSIDYFMKNIREDLSSLGVHHDTFFFESTLHQKNAKAIKETINFLKKKGYIYQGRSTTPKGKNNLSWRDREQVLLRSIFAGDDVDRSLTRIDGSYTYFASDIAYFKNKYDRGFQEIVYVLGSDHTGYVKRLQAAALGIADNNMKLQVILYQIVRLYRSGEQIRMSKRDGNFIKMRDVINEVGRDVLRFMMIYRTSTVPLDFDFLKTVEKSKENPVFYLQYATARCSSIFRQAFKNMNIQEDSWIDYAENFYKLENVNELKIIKKLSEYPRIIEMSTQYKEPHRLAFYLYSLASFFHIHWNKGQENSQLRFLQKEDRNLTIARLGLVKAIENVLSSGLKIIGVQAPKEMI